MTRWSLFLQTLSLLHHFLGLYFGAVASSLYSPNPITGGSMTEEASCNARNHQTQYQAPRCWMAWLWRSPLRLSSNPPMDRDGRREESGRGRGRYRRDDRGLKLGRREVGGRSAGTYGGSDGGLEWLWEREGGIGHGKRRSGTGLARVSGDVGLAGGSVADGRRQAGRGMACSWARARLNCSFQGQRWGRWRVNRRAERVIRPAEAKTGRLRVLVVTIC